MSASTTARGRALDQEGSAARPNRSMGDLVDRVGGARRALSGPPRGR